MKIIITIANQAYPGARKSITLLDEEFPLAQTEVLFNFTKGVCGHFRSVDWEGPSCPRGCPDHNFTITVRLNEEGLLSVSMESTFVYSDEILAHNMFFEHIAMMVAARETDIRDLEEQSMEFLKELNASINPETLTFDTTLLQPLGENKAMIEKHLAEIKRMKAIDKIPFTQTVRRSTSNPAIEGRFTNFISPITHASGECAALYAVMVQRQEDMFDFTSSPIVEEMTTLHIDLPMRSDPS